MSPLSPIHLLLHLGFNNAIFTFIFFFSLWIVIVLFSRMIMARDDHESSLEQLSTNLQDCMRINDDIHIPEEIVDENESSLEQLLTTNLQDCMRINDDVHIPEEIVDENESSLEQLLTTNLQDCMRINDDAHILEEIMACDENDSSLEHLSTTNLQDCMRIKDDVHIPEEIMEKILLLLPPKSLMRFRCVSKSLCSLIEDPTFRAKHFHCSTKNDVPSSSISLFLIFDITKKKRMKKRGYTIRVPKPIYMNCDASYNPLFDYSTAAELPTLNIDKGASDDAHNYIHCTSEYVKLGVSEEMIRDKRLVGMSSQCDGLLCLCDYRGNVFLCNPTTKECRTLPPCLAKQYDHRYDYLMESSCGLGYDPRDKDYKIIMIVRSCHGDAEPRAELYSLRSNSWREMDLGNAKDVTRGFNRKKVYLNGVYYYLSSCTLNPQVMVSFDMSEEEFNCISLSTCCDYCDSIAVWNERVVVFSINHRNLKLESVMEMWVMDGGGHASHVRGSSNSCLWTKHSVIRINPGVDKAEPLLFWKGDDELLLEILDEETEKRKLLSYNIGTGKFRYLAFGDGSSPDHDQGYDSLFSIRNVLPYVKTVVSVKGGE